MIPDRYKACLTPGPTFKPDVFCEPFVKALMTPEERQHVQELLVQVWLRKTPSQRQDRKRDLMKQEVEV